MTENEISKYIVSASKGITMSFENTLESWLSDGLSVNIPGNVKAFSFNLFEPAGKDGVKFGIEIIGASEFDPDDEDWACEKVWEPKQRRLSIPTSYSGETWEECLKTMKQSYCRTA